MCLRPRFGSLPLFAVLANFAGCSGSFADSPQPLTQPVVAATATEKEGGIADFPSLNAERDWPWWRGPQRNGIATPNANVPSRWSQTENVRWKTKIPGRGHSSPTVVGQRVFLSSADHAKEIQSVIAVDLKDGKLLWSEAISEGGFPRSIHSKNTHATPTVASDGNSLFVTFFHHDAIHMASLNLDGKLHWKKSLGEFRPKRYEYGYAPSPAIYRETVIVSAEYDGDSFIIALNRKSGDEIWRTARPNNVSYSSPTIAFIAGRDQLLISGADQICSYDPNNGKPLWAAAGTTAATCGTAVWHKDLVFASGGYPGSETIAIRADGSGEVVWRNKQKCYEQSMIVVDGHLYALTDNGILYCWNAETGEEKWRQRLRGPISASPIYVSGSIHWSNERGTTYVFKPNPDRFELVAENQLGDESFASPAVSGSDLLLRVADQSDGARREYLYCISSERSARVNESPAE